MGGDQDHWSAESTLICMAMGPELSQLQGVPTPWEPGSVLVVTSGGDQSVLRKGLSSPLNFRLQQFVTHGKCFTIVVKQTQ